MVQGGVLTFRTSPLLKLSSLSAVAVKSYFATASIRRIQNRTEEVRVTFLQTKN